MRKKFLSLALMAALCLSMVVPAVAASPPSELELAAAYVREHGIMTGDQNGNLNLDAGLNRAQLAVILTRLSDETGDMGRHAEYYRTVCPFTDVPKWAMPYTGYCAEKNLMSGYGNRLFGPNDAVTPAAACTVMLRVCGIADGEGSIWSYGTACSYGSTAPRPAPVQVQRPAPALGTAFYPTESPSPKKTCWKFYVSLNRIGPMGRSGAHTIRLGPTKTRSPALQPTGSWTSTGSVSITGAVATPPWSAPLFLETRLIRAASRTISRKCALAILYL